jgi:hypothetical protein
MDEAQSAKPSCSSAEPADIGQLQVRGVPKNDVSNEAVARKENADLPPQFPGDCGDILGQFRRYDLSRGDASPEGTFQCAALRLLNAESISVYGMDESVSLLA